jgi:hypothetical protein
MVGGSGWFSSNFGGSLIGIPLSLSILVVTKKKISSKKAISAIEPALISGNFLEVLAMV